MIIIITTINFYLILHLASLLFVKPLLLIDPKIVHILDVDIDFQQIIVHFLVQVVVYDLQEYVSVEYLHLMYTIIYR